MPDDPNKGGPASVGMFLALLALFIACSGAETPPADVLATTQPSIVRILTPNGSGTGFIVAENGLVITNRHVVEGNRNVIVRLYTGEQYEGAVTQLHASLDLAYVEIQSNQTFAALAIGDSSDVSVGQTVIAIGYPLADDLGLDPTISKGIISAMRDDYLQTDASLNPGNSGGPLLTEDGKVIGLISARAEETKTGRAVTGIGFAIPINDVKPGLPVGIASGNSALGETPAPTPTPSPTVPPTLLPTPDVQATIAALEAEDRRRRAVAEATRIAEQAQQEAEQYAASLEATRIAEMPTPTPTPRSTPTPTPLPTATPTPTPLPTHTPTPEPTPTPLPPTPTPTPHPATFCKEWKALVLEWVKQGNTVQASPEGDIWSTNVPDHPQLSAHQAGRHCVLNFPEGRLFRRAEVGDEPWQLLPGLYEFRTAVDDGELRRVPKYYCRLELNKYESNETIVHMPSGEPFTFRFFTYHGDVELDCPGGGSLRRIED